MCTDRQSAGWFRGVENGVDQSLDLGPRSSVDMNCTAPGWYRVTARSGNAETTEDVNVGPGQAQAVTLRLATVTGAASGGATVSAAQLREPEKVRKQLEKARQRLSKQDLVGAMKYINDALKAYPQSSEAYQLRGLVTLTEGHPNEAVSDLDRAVKLDSNNVTAHIVLGAALNAVSKFKEAAMSLRSVLPKAPQVWQIQYELGKAYAGMGELKDALAAMDRAFSMNPKFAPIRYARGAILFHAHQYADAVRELKQYLQDDPKGDHSESARHLLAKAQAGGK
jgi:tetratricopeptide (TPR) repeat protein